MLLKHTGQHPNNLKATPIYRLLIWFANWSYTCFGNIVVNILVISKLHQYKNYKFCLPFQVTGCI